MVLCEALREEQKFVANLLKEESNYVKYFLTILRHI